MWNGESEGTQIGGDQTIAEAWRLLVRRLSAKEGVRIAHDFSNARAYEFAGTASVLELGDVPHDRNVDVGRVRTVVHRGREL